MRGLLSFCGRDNPRFVFTRINVRSLNYLIIHD